LQRSPDSLHFPTESKKDSLPRRQRAGISIISLFPDGLPDAGPGPGRSHRIITHPRRVENLYASGRGKAACRLHPLSSVGENLLPPPVSGSVRMAKDRQQFVM